MTTTLPPGQTQVRCSCSKGFSSLHEGLPSSSHPQIPPSQQLGLQPPPRTPGSLALLLLSWKFIIKKLQNTLFFGICQSYEEEVQVWVFPSQRRVLENTHTSTSKFSLIKTTFFNLECHFHDGYYFRSKCPCFSIMWMWRGCCYNYETKHCTSTNTGIPYPRNRAPLLIRTPS